MSPRRHVKPGRDRPTKVGPTSRNADRAHSSGQQPGSGSKHRSEAITDTDIESRGRGRRQHPVVDTDGNRAFRQQRGTHVTRREDRDDPASTDAPFQHSGDDAKNEHGQNRVDDAIDPQRAGSKNEDWMLRQVVDIGTRKPQDRVMITGVEHAKHDAASRQQCYVDEREWRGAPGRQHLLDRRVKGLEPRVQGSGRRQRRQRHHCNLPDMPTTSQKTVSALHGPNHVQRDGLPDWTLILANRPTISRAGR